MFLSVAGYYKSRLDIISIALLLVCLCLTFILYHKGFHGPLLLDDAEHLAPLMSNELTNDGWKEFIFNHSGPLKRPVAMSTFIANSISSGDYIYRWKYTNLMIHLLTAISIFWFTTYLFIAADNKINRRSVWFLALAPAIIWLFHPLHVSTVLYTVQRMTQLSALFVFLGLTIYLAGRLRQLAGSSGSTYILFAFLFFLPLGALSKENALLFPVYVLLIELFFFKFKVLQNNTIKVNQTIKYILLLPLFLIFIFIILNFQDIVLKSYETRDFTLNQRLLTEFRILLIYIGEIIFPLQSSMGFIHDDIVLSDNWFSPASTIISFIVISILLFIAWFSRLMFPLIGFGIAFYFMAHLMESTILPLELMYEHRNYVPSYGVILAITVSLYRFISNDKLRIFIIACMISILSVQTKIRADIWSSAPRLYSHMFNIHPNSEKLSAVQARILTEAGLYNDARLILSRYNSKGSILQRLYTTCHELGHLHENDLSIALSSFDGPVDMYAISELNKLAGLGLEGQCEFSKSEYISLLDRILELPIAIDFEKHRLLVYKAHYLWKISDINAAINTLQKATEIVPDDPIPMLLAAEWSFKSGQFNKATYYYDIAEEISEKSYKNYDTVFTAVQNLIYSDVR